MEISGQGVGQFIKSEWVAKPVRLGIAEQSGGWQGVFRFPDARSAGSDQERAIKNLSLIVDSRPTGQISCHEPTPS